MSIPQIDKHYVLNETTNSLDFSDEVVVLGKKKDEQTESVINKAKHVFHGDDFSEAASSDVAGALKDAGFIEARATLIGNDLENQSKDIHALMLFAEQVLPHLGELQKINDAQKAEITQLLESAQKESGKRKLNNELAGKIKKLFTSFESNTNEICKRYSKEIYRLSLEHCNRMKDLLVPSATLKGSIQDIHLDMDKKLEGKDKDKDKSYKVTIGHNTALLDPVTRQTRHNQQRLENIHSWKDTNVKLVNEIIEANDNSKKNQDRIDKLKANMDADQEVNKERTNSILKAAEEVRHTFGMNTKDLQDAQNEYHSKMVAQLSLRDIDTEELYTDLLKELEDLWKPYKSTLLSEVIRILKSGIKGDSYIPNEFQKPPVKKKN